ncbi:MAG: Rieske 2Fe-2S domain-containing protein [Actinomycetota bacterium]
MTRWFPIADCFDAIPRHVVRASLHGQELVVWRADDGTVNVWENRCLHRGVRLSIGTNDGAELVCRYHAWRYANRSGGCTYIPAHPADAPARTVHCSTYPVVERHGLIWTTLASEPERRAEAPTEDPGSGLLGDDAFVLRARLVNAPAAVATAALLEHAFTPAGAVNSEKGVAPTEVDGGVVLGSPSTVDGERVVVFVQPLDSQRAILRPVRAGTPDDPQLVWRHHGQWLGRLVEEIEAQPRLTVPAPVDETPVAIPVASSGDRLTVTIAAKWVVADEIAGFDLVAADAQVLPASQPGDHIDVHLPGGLVRQYSLTNGPGQTGLYRLGVKRTVDSRGGSAYLHETATVGDTLEISAPRNHFPLRRNVPNTILIAGGIGITPIVSMAQALAHTGLTFVVHYFASSDGEFAFADVLGQFGDAVHQHSGLDPDVTGMVLERILGTPNAATQVVACGPPPMLNRIREIAVDAGWPDEAVSFEYFTAGDVDRSSAFVVELARSARTIEVRAGQTVLEALRADGTELASSCERGACGTCAVTVVDGAVDHRDVYLNAAERSAGDTMLACVSRAASGRLVLDV